MTERIIIDKKKMLIFVESLSCGGAEKSLTTMLNKIDIHNFDIELLMLKKGGDFEVFLPPNVKVKYLDWSPNIVSRIKFKIIKKINMNSAHNAQLLWKCIKDNVPGYNGNYNIAIGWGQGFATYYIAKKVRADKKLSWINTDYRKAGYLWSCDKDIYGEIDVIVAVSEHINQIMSPLVGQEKVITIPDIVDEADVLNLSITGFAYELSTSVHNIVTVARLEKQKTLNLAVEAASILNKKDVDFHWYIIGEGSERAFLEKIIIDKSLEDKITLLGFRENPYPYMREASVYVQTSEFEGLGLTLIEAVILNRPIVSTNFPTAYGILKGKDNALIVEKTGEDIAIAIEELLSKTSKDKDLSLNENKPKSDLTAKTIELVERILNN